MRRMMGFELKKIFLNRTALAAIAAVLVLNALYVSASYRSQYAYDGQGQEGHGGEAVEIDRAVAARYAGPLTDEAVRQMLADFPVPDLHGMNPRYYYINAIQSAVYTYFVGMDGQWNGLTVQEVFGGEEIAVGYNKGWLTVSGDLQKGYVILSLLILVLTAPVFSREYGGMDSLILSSRYGPDRCAAAKCASALASAAALALAFGLGTFLAGLVLYGKEGLASSIRFSPVEYEGLLPYDITCGKLIGRQVLLGLTSALAVAGVTLLASALCRGQMAALAAAAAVHLLPLAIPVPETNPLYRVAVLAPVMQAQGIAVLAVGPGYWVLAAAAAGALAGGGSSLAAKIFGGRSA